MTIKITTIDIVCRFVAGLCIVGYMCLLFWNCKGETIMKYWKHFKTVIRHKYVVFKECKSCGILWQGLIHDMSKFSPIEFFSSARYFQGTRSPIEAEKDTTGYSKAWLHHKGHNKHHWEYWTDFDDNGDIIPIEIPIKYVVEMACDWVGAGMVYSKEKWTQSEPINYFHKVRKGRHFHPKTEELLIYLLEQINLFGLDKFHSEARLLIKQKR